MTADLAKWFLLCLVVVIKQMTRTNEGDKAHNIYYSSVSHRHFVFKIKETQIVFPAKCYF